MLYNTLNVSCLIHSNKHVHNKVTKKTPTKNSLSIISISTIKYVIFRLDTQSECLE